MQMSFRNSYIGIAVATTIMVTALLVSGGDLSDGAKQAVGLGAWLVGFVVLFALEIWDERRGISR
jgi:uncharacterized membrane protein